MTAVKKVEDCRPQGWWLSDHDFAVMIKENPDQKDPVPH
jgi:hypothetical protein